MLDIKKLNTMELLREKQKASEEYDAIKKEWSRISRISSGYEVEMYLGQKKTGLTRKEYMEAYPPEVTLEMLQTAQDDTIKAGFKLNALRQEIKERAERVDKSPNSFYRIGEAFCFTFIKAAITSSKITTENLAENTSTNTLKA